MLQREEKQTTGEAKHSGNPAYSLQLEGIEIEGVPAQTKT
jgi:hypothetical protein